MRIDRTKKLLTLWTLLAFSFVLLFSDYGFAQEETPLARAQDLLSQGKYDEAVKALDGYIAEIQDKPEKKPDLAAANYLLAKVYFEVGDDEKCDAALLAVYTAHPGFDQTEPNFGLRERVTKIKAQLAGNIPAASQPPAVQEVEVKATEVKAIPVPPQVEPKVAAPPAKVAPTTVEKPKSSTATVVKKRKKFPWLLAVLGIGVVIAVIVLLAKKKGGDNSQTNETGSIQVNSTPTGAKIYLDGTDTGKITNATLTSVAVGSHTVKLTLSGFTNYTTTVTVTQGQTANINGTMINNEMISIPGGSFQMGSTSSEAYSWEQPVHTVTLSSFQIGRYEVTQGQWKMVMGSNPAYFPKGDNYPVENVSWDDAQTFIQKLNAMSGQQYRLPTEAEWEYACRAGTNGDRYGNLDSIAWYVSNSGATTHPGGQKQANAWGLADMLGNVWEWCSDWYGPYSSAAQTNPTGPSSGSARVIRGGCWNDDARIARAANRRDWVPGIRNSYLGFRLAMN